ncbi:hypothetical protein ACWDY7_01415 [Streptomyces calvus]|uniref:Uncharacterized protein n=1 Tax=Streptomyces calvus TaxID=67282 RepID=A0AA40VFU0_9ACTN|nr:hypothetical protein [Streptomyces calvus]MBA8943083.1 hypothetical protein [Streptomyces calvus]GGP35069.1 hypothetical protein GCM10010247_03520 [Streptomyces calvus]
MIRFITAARLRRLEQEAGQARARAREVQEEADAAWSRHVRELWDLTARAETAESDAAILWDHVLEAEAALKKAEARAEGFWEDAERQEAALERADADAAVLRERVRLLEVELAASKETGRWLVLLLHRGEPHSIHRSQADAQAYVATRGIPVHAWEASDERPASEVLWRIVPFTRDAAVNGFRSVSVPSPTGSEGAA